MTMTAVRPEDCLAQHEGDLSVSGLDGPVRIVRDRWGIAHAEASSARDAFFAQGYCLGQDRLWQLELYRHLAHGRGAELLGKGLLRRDQQNRRLRFGADAAREWDAQTDRARMILQAYADGVNAAITSNPTPYEFHVLDDAEAPHEMQPWHPIDSLAILKMVAAGATWATKLSYAKIAATLGPEAVAALVTDIPEGSALITPSGARWTEDSHPFHDDTESAGGEPDGIVAAGGGSNCWVIDGTKSATGRPIVCGDPHLAISVPGQWYVMTMQCPEFTVAGPCSPGYPGPVYYGHNTKIAWTMTHAQGDRWDLYRERITRATNGASTPSQPRAEFRGVAEPLTRRDERFAVRNGDSVEMTMWDTRHGPVIAGNPESDDEVVSTRYGLAEPAHDMDALWGVITATDASELREGIRLYDSISGNYCFADQAGTIGYQYAGRIPKRPAWLVPVPGWDGDHEWDGDVPKDELPTDENPANGFFVTANNKTTTPDYPHFLSAVASRFRADRLRELMDDVETFSLDDMPRLQQDLVSIAHREAVAHLVSFEASDDRARAMQALLRGWDSRMTADSAGAAAANEARNRLAAITIEAYYQQVPGLPPQRPVSHLTLLTQLASRSPVMLGAFPSWDAAMEQALVEAADALTERQGADPQAWRWAPEHQIEWSHNLGRDPELKPIFDLEPLPMQGDRNTIWNAGTPVGGAGVHGVSYRQVLDMGDLNGARIVIPPGNSGQPGSAHYADNIDRWLNGEYHPLFVEWADIEANAEAELRLTS
ncbi:MAG: penicillin acylase family protein [Chloroflexi bacterium]|nr:penicillin acylase family protein [Chloroflexota bacterium]MDA1147522.1 penicillin acylase family protein [Chloroflexota bacterium]